MTEQLFIENSYTDSYKLQNPISINLDIPAKTHLFNLGIKNINN